MALPLRVLMLEDDPADAELALSVLRRAGFILVATQVDNEQDFRKHLQSAPDMILADFSLPLFSGLAALEILQEIELDIPLIFLSGSIGEEGAIELLKKGAADFVMKDSLGRLGPAITQALEKKLLRDDVRNVAQQLEHSAFLLTLSAEVAIALTRGDSLIDMLTRCTESLVLNLDAAFARIWTYDDEQCLVLNPRAATPCGGQAAPAAEPLGRVQIESVAQRRQAYSTNTAFGDPNLDDQVWAQRNAIAAYSAHPLFVKSRLVGVMEIFSQKTFPPTTLAALRGVAVNIGLGIERMESERSLAEATKAADTANRAKSEFLANMSHKIRTPMNGILGTTELMLATPLSCDQQECMATIQESGNALLTIINDILDFSKVEAGMLELEEIPFNLPNHLESVIRILTSRASEKGLVLHYHFDPTVPTWISGDPDRLRQIMMNLIGNAIKFTDHGSITLRVTTQEGSCEDQASVRLHFAVSDTGIGIVPEKQEMIFDVFSQADNSTTRRFGGTGLGLSITSRLVTLMGGRIWVESDVSCGSTFHFTACFRGSGRCESESLAMRADVLTSRPPCPIATDGCVPTERSARPHNLTMIPRSLNLLIAEDNRINQRVARRMLNMLGHEVSVVENGRIALAMLEQSKFDAVLMDVQMPVMDGFETTAAIRAQERVTGRRTYIIGATSHALKGDRERCLGAGMNDYISKPMSVSKLKSVLSAVQTPALAAEDCDIASAIRRVDGDVDCFNELVSMLSEDAPEQIADIRVAIEDRNSLKLELTCHRLRGSLIPFAATDASRAVQSLETMGRQQDLTYALAGFETLDVAVKQLLATLKHWDRSEGESPANTVLTTVPNHPGNSTCTV